MHTVRCHAKSVPEGPLDGRRGQSGQSGNCLSFFISMICQRDEEDRETYGGERRILRGPQIRDLLRRQPQECPTAAGGDAQLSVNRLSWSVMPPLRLTSSITFSADVKCSF